MKIPLPFFLLPVAAVGGFFLLNRNPPEVKIIHPARRSVAETVVASGEVRGRICGLVKMGMDLGWPLPPATEADAAQAIPRAHCFRKYPSHCL